MIIKFGVMTPEIEAKIISIMSERKCVFCGSSNRDILMREGCYSWRNRAYQHNSAVKNNMLYVMRYHLWVCDDCRVTTWGRIRNFSKWIKKICEIHGLDYDMKIDEVTQYKIICIVRSQAWNS